jgi:hypothetical protein
MSERTEALLAINARQADTADDALLTLLTEDETSRRIVTHDRADMESYVDPQGGKHVIQTVRP